MWIMNKRLYRIRQQHLPPQRVNFCLLYGKALQRQYSKVGYNSMFNPYATANLKTLRCYIYNYVCSDEQTCLQNFQVILKHSLQNY